MQQYFKFAMVCGSFGSLEAVCGVLQFSGGLASRSPSP